MNEEKEYIQKESEDSKPWYAKKGDDSDVFLTSRIRFARNLANFPFPNRFRGDDRQRVNAILLDVFSKVKNPDDFHLIPMENLSPQNYYILQERGILKPKNEVQNLNISQPTSIVMNSRGDISILINQIDHLRLSAFKSGLDFTTSFSLLRDLDSFFQEHVQFASSLEFGYLTCAMKDLGSGIKFSARANLKMSVNACKIRELKKKAEESQMALLPSFPYYTNDGGLPAGIFYDIVSTKAINGSDVSQLAEMEALCSFIAFVETIS
ncbi:MAG: hypothetical protein K6E78_05590 [Treponema sp.]|nr:hypothetical protein [Treponema sp.]